MSIMSYNNADIVKYWRYSSLHMYATLLCLWLPRKQQEATLKKYEAIWSSYQAKYDSSPAALERAAMLQEVKSISDESEHCQ